MSQHKYLEGVEVAPEWVVVALKARVELAKESYRSLTAQSKVFALLISEEEYISKFMEHLATVNPLTWTNGGTNAKNT